MYISSAADFPLFCSNSARKCHILTADCSPQKSPILLEILPAKFIQAYHAGENAEISHQMFKVLLFCDRERA